MTTWRGVFGIAGTVAATALGVVFLGLSAPLGLLVAFAVLAVLVNRHANPLWIRQLWPALSWGVCVSVTSACAVSILVDLRAAAPNGLCLGIADGAFEYSAPVVPGPRRSGMALRWATGEMMTGPYEVIHAITDAGSIITHRWPIWAMLPLAWSPLLLKWAHAGCWPAGSCQRCGYDLMGNTTGRCPECGARCGGATSAGSQADL